MLTVSARFAFSLALAMMLLAILVPQTAAQEATPAGTDRAAFVPAPEECTVEPRSAESLATLATPSAATPAAMGELEIPFGAPDGEAADPETTAAVTALIRQTWACLNAGDYARFLALMTDAEAARSLPPELILETAAGAAPVAAGPLDEQTAVYAILDVERLPDGRVGAFVMVDTPFDPLPVEVNYQIAVETDDGWRLDQFICYSGEGSLC
jgi:hypothetical protein